MSFSASPYEVVGSKHTDPRVVIQAKGAVLLNDTDQHCVGSQTVVRMLSLLIDDRNRMEVDKGLNVNDQLRTGIPAPYPLDPTIFDQLLGENAGTFFFWQHEERRRDALDAEVRRTFVDAEDRVYSAEAKFSERQKEEEQRASREKESQSIRVASKTITDEGVDSAKIIKIVKIDSSPSVSDRSMSVATPKNVGVFATSQQGGLNINGETITAFVSIANVLGEGIGALFTSTANIVGRGFSQVKSSLEGLVTKAKDVVSSLKMKGDKTSYSQRDGVSPQDESKRDASFISNSIESIGIKIKNTFENATKASTQSVDMATHLFSRAFKEVSSVFAFKAAAAANEQTGEPSAHTGDKEQRFAEASEDKAEPNLT